MKIEISAHQRKHSFETEHDDVTIDEVMDGLYGLLVAAGFHRDTVVNGFADIAEERKEG